MSSLAKSSINLATFLDNEQGNEGSRFWNNFGTEVNCIFDSVSQLVRSPFLSQMPQGLPPSLSYSNSSLWQMH